MNSIVKLIANATPGEKRFVLFAGAGVSKDAGIPTSWDLTLKIASLLYAVENEKNISKEKNIDYEKWFLNSKYVNMTYSDLIKELFPTYPAQQNFLQQYLGSKKPGKVHELIAELARREIIRAIITTNFDHYIEDALKEKGLNVQVISTDEDLKNSEPLIQCKKVRIYKPHGDLGKGMLRNTATDLERLSDSMEKEIARVLSEHGVMVLGYSGRDRDIQRIFEMRNYNYYQVFWINPNPPKGKIKNILENKGYVYIPCTSASQFLKHFFELMEELEQVAPSVESGPTVFDLENAFSSNKQVDSLYQDFLKEIFKKIEQTKPDFSKFENMDDAIVDQITKGLNVSYSFIKAGLLASKYNDLEVAKIIYEFFGHFLVLHEPPVSVGTYQPIKFDGFRFLTYEMFVSFIAGLIKYDRWNILGEILSEELFIDKEGDSKYIPFAHISRYITSLDEIRNKRLNLNRISIMADFLKDRFTQTKLSELISFKEFVEADYFLFVRSVIHEEDTNYLYNTWCPRSCVYLNWIPKYIARAESKRFLDKLSKASGLKGSEEFKEKFKERHGLISKYFKPEVLWNDPLWSYDLDKLGSIE